MKSLIKIFWILSIPFYGSVVIRYELRYRKTMALGILWGSIAASVTQTFNVTYIPQFIGFTIATIPTAFSINVQGDGVIFNMDGNGLTSMSNIRLVGVVANTYVYQLANGLINGKNASVTIANATAAQLDVYAWSKDQGNIYMSYLTQNALLNSGITLQDFAYAAFPSAGAADSFTIEYNSKITQVNLRLEEQFAIGYTQNVATARYNIDNIAPSLVKKVTYIPTTSQNVYVMQYQAAKGTVNAAVVAKG
jgi:hypothetical protein